jgi:putative methionine-R-sulfoxide reductase with GAF domain
MDSSIRENILEELAGRPDSSFDELCDLAVGLLYEGFEHFSWVGVYMTSGDELHLKSWRGPAETEHTRIPIGDGICGSAAESGRTEVVDDVAADERYIACFVSTKSEIVVPILVDGNVVGEIDVDSDTAAAFGSEDRAFLEKVAAILGESTKAE